MDTVSTRAGELCAQQRRRCVPRVAERRHPRRLIVHCGGQRLAAGTAIEHQRRAAEEDERARGADDRSGERPCGVVALH